MIKLMNFLMIGMAFTAFQVSTAVANDCSDFTPGTPAYGSCMAKGAGDTTGHSPVDISHCADMPPTTRPACEAQAHSGPPLNADGTPMTGGHHPPVTGTGVALTISDPACVGPLGETNPACPNYGNTAGGPDGHHPPVPGTGVALTIR